MKTLKKALVVDDEPLVIKGCRRILTEAGYQVDTTLSGREGMRLALGGHFDLLLTDLKMPDMDGMELVRALRARRPETAIIVITGYGTVPSAVEATRLGVADYIQKPFTPEEITEAANRAVEAARGGRGLSIDADAVRAVLRTASNDGEFGLSLLTRGSRVLSGYTLTPEAKAAIVSGDIAWIEKECGELSAEEREWLDRRLQAEVW